MALKIVTPPAEEPVTTEEAKAYMRVVSATDDALIALLIKTVRELGENITRRAWITQTWNLILDGFPTGGIRIPMPPLQSIASIKYTDTDGSEQTMDALDYTVDDDSEPGMVVPVYGTVWPVTLDEVNAVRVQFVAGYGSASDVPESLKTWMKVRVGTLYEHREALVVGQAVAAIPRDFVDGLLDSYRVWTFE